MLKEIKRKADTEGARCKAGESFERSPDDMELRQSLGVECCPWVIASKRTGPNDLSNQN